MARRNHNNRISRAERVEEEKREFRANKEEELLEKLRYFTEHAKKAEGKEIYLYDQIIYYILVALRDNRFAYHADDQHYPDWKLKLATEEMAITVLSEVFKAMEEQAAGIYVKEAEEYLKIIGVV